MIPLRDGCVSVGAVCSPDYLKQREGSQAEFLMRTLHSVPDVHKRMVQAEITGNLHVTGNYSVFVQPDRRPALDDGGGRLRVPRPRSSPPACTSPCIAPSSRRMWSSSPCASLAKERSLQRRYHRNVRHGIDSLAWFIYRFNTPGIAWLFRNPRNIMRVEEAMISMLAGDVFRDNGVRWRLHFFKLLYYITSTVYWRESLASWIQRRRRASMRFSGGTTGRMPPDRSYARRMSDVATSLFAPRPHRASSIARTNPDVPLPRDVLGAVAFRDRSPRQNDPRIVRVGLKPLIGADIIEIWHASGPVSIGFDGIVR